MYIKRSKLMVLGTFSVLAMILFSCGGKDDSSKDKCNTDTDCASGHKCNEGTCMSYEGGGFLCSNSNPCPKGQFCFNGLCAIGCTTDDNCANNQYCDTEWEHMCVNKEVHTCPDTPCASNQECIKGLCSAKAESEKCTPRPDGKDGCDKYSICIDKSDADAKEQDLSCVSFPPCPQDGACPVGTVGAVCNEGYIPNKARICLTGLCKSEDNCPSGFNCITPQGSQLGMCGSGAFGSPCLSSSDCQDGLSCLGAITGVPGFCMPGGGGGNDCIDAGGACVDPMKGCPDGTVPDGTKSCSSMGEICCMKS